MDLANIDNFSQCMSFFAYQNCPGIARPKATDYYAPLFFLEFLLFLPLSALFSLLSLALSPAGPTPAMAAGVGVAAWSPLTELVSELALEVEVEAFLDSGCEPLLVFFTSPSVGHAALSPPATV